jgi:arylsulfatase A-like enzyme
MVVHHSRYVWGGAAAGVLAMSSLGTGGLGMAGEATTTATPAAAASAPNILVVVTDDQRYSETLAVQPHVRGFFGEAGTEYTNAMVTTPLCCPSRSSLFSGRYSHNTGITGNGLPDRVAAFDQEATVQGYLHSAGYSTAIVGKFLNTYPLSRSPRNWDRWATTTGGYNDVAFNVDGSVRKTTGYYITPMESYTTSILTSFESQDDRPWLLYVAPEAPHSGYTPEAKYASAPVPPAVHPPSWNEADVTDKPKPVRWRSPVTESAYQTRRTQMLRTLMSVDDLVAQVTDTMAELGEDTNTLAVYMGDNGYLWAEHRIMDKRFPYLESVEVPFLVRWPGHVPAGARSDRLVTQIDLLPTFLEAAGVHPTLRYPLDGQSLLSSPDRSEVYLEYAKSADAPLGPWASLRGRTWQYVEWYDTSTGALTFSEYYDLTVDPFQLSNMLHDGIKNDEPPIAPFHDRLARARTCVGAACP